MNLTTRQLNQLLRLESRLRRLVKVWRKIGWISQASDLERALKEK